MKQEPLLNHLLNTVTITLFVFLHCKQIMWKALA